MPDRPIRILFLEDNAADAERVGTELTRADVAHATERVDSEAAFVSALRDFAPDVVLSDHAPAKLDADVALRVVGAYQPTTPVIVVTDAPSVESAVYYVKAGADDYIGTDNLSRLAPAIRQALEVRKPLGRLTPRQREVLRLLAQGLPTREIAARLELSVKTIETHRAEVMKRLGMRDVPRLVRFAIRVRLIGLDAS